MKSLVVLPTYNERENIEAILKAILDQAADLDVLVVDDNSPDGTGHIADRLAQSDAAPVGAFGACHSPDTPYALLRDLNGNVGEWEDACDAGPPTVGRDTCNVRGGSFYARVILGMPVRDLTSGFKCFSRRVLEHLDLQTVDSNGYAFQVEMNYRCNVHGFRVAEVPIVFVDRRVGKSKMGSHIVTEAMLVVLRLRLQTLLGGKGQSAAAAAAKYSRTP